MALENFLGESFYDWAWVMDDDIIPEPDCLERLQDQAYAERGPAFVFPTRSNRMERWGIGVLGAASSSPKRSSKRSGSEGGAALVGRRHGVLQVAHPQRRLPWRPGSGCIGAP